MADITNPKPIEEKKEIKVKNRRVHMANERTFLAWIRTSIGIMAFGFVVEKFSLFVKQMAFIIEKSGYSGPRIEGLTTGRGYSSILGIFLIGFGALMGVLSFIRYKKVERQIDDDTYEPSLILDLMITICIVSIALFFVVYLVRSM